jgi:hypothetical protein
MVLKLQPVLVRVPEGVGVPQVLPERLLMPGAGRVLKNRSATCRLFNNYIITHSFTEFG